MKTPRVILSAAVLLAVSAAGLAQTAPKAAGHWEGTIHMPNRDVGAVVDLAQNAQGAWAGSMTVSGSTSVDGSLADITAEGTTVRFTVRLAGNPFFEGKLPVPAISGTYRGTLVSVDEITGEWTQDGKTLPLNFRRSTAAAKTSKLWKASHPRTESSPAAWPTVLIRGFAPFAPYLDFAVVPRRW